MNRNVEEPIVEAQGPPFNGTKSEHPAYAMIGAARVTGHACLFGSDFIHHHFVRVRLLKATQRRHLSQEWYHGDDRYIEVDLSEAQWATFVSSMNVGDGVPCTARYVGGEEVPLLPNPKAIKEQFESDAMEDIEKALAGIEELRTSIVALTVSQKKKEELLDHANTIERNMRDGIPFVMESAAKHMENVVEKAKIEVNAYATSHLMKLGLESATQLQIEDKKGE